VEIAEARGLFPTGMTSAEIRETLLPSARRGAVLSARTNSAAYLQRVKDVTRDFIDGKINKATARVLLKEELDRLGYDPQAGGFADEDPAEPADPDSLRDLRSDKRLELVLETQARQALNQGYVEQWASASQRRAFPAWEMVRIAYRATPRGTVSATGREMSKGWPARWREAGGKFYGGRMIARVDDPVWLAIGSSTLFDDGLDSPWPPFAFNSGYGIGGVARREAIRLGVIGADDVPGTPDVEATAPFNPIAREEAKPEGTAGKLDKDLLRKLRASLDRDLKGWDSGDVMRRELERARGGAK
jgi:hypothetical protein